METPNATPGERSGCEIFSVSLLGLVASLVTITVTIEPGSSALDLVGLAEHRVQQTKGQVFSALARGLGIWLDGRIVTVRVSDVHAHAEGMLELAIATAVLAALEGKQLPPVVVLGELSRTGSVCPVRGALPALLGVRHIPRAIVPWENRADVARVPDMDIRLAAHIGDVLHYLRGGRELEPAARFATQRRSDVDLADVRGLLPGRRAVEISAAGLHPLVLVGSSGSGKVTLGARLGTVMPPMSEAEANEVTSIHSVAGKLDPHRGLMTERPFRLPPYLARERTLIGGGVPACPGEVSLAHHGVLMLDDLQAFNPRTLAAVGKVLRSGRAVLDQHGGRVVFPARPLLVAGVLRCPCGFLGEKDRTCTCSPEQIKAYRERLRGDVFDRIAMTAKPGDHVASAAGESSAKVRARVIRARSAQEARFARGEVSALVNGRLRHVDLERVAKPDRAGARLLAAAELSANLQAKALRLARTIADLDGSDAVKARHVEEAISLVPRAMT